MLLLQNFWPQSDLKSTRALLSGKARDLLMRMQQLHLVGQSLTGSSNGIQASFSFTKVARVAELGGGPIECKDAFSSECWRSHQ
jgi:hypothetical protein